MYSSPELNKNEQPSRPLLSSENNLEAPKKNRKKFIAIGLGATAAVAGAAAIIGLNLPKADSAEQQNNIPPAPNPDATSEIQPSAEPVVENGEKSIEQLINETKIESGLSAEVYTKTLLEDRIPNWILGGSNEEYFNEKTAVTSDDYVIETRIAEEQSNINTNALFVPGWQSNQNLVNINDFYTEYNIGAKIDWLRAHDFEGSLGTPDWEEGMVVEMTEVLEETDEGRTIYTAGYQTNNAAETSNSKSVNAKNNGASWNYTITTTVIDGHEYVSDWTN